MKLNSSQCMLLCNLDGSTSKITCSSTEIIDLISDHEEADSKIFVYANYVAELENINRIVIQSPDTDVKIIACHQQSSVLINLPKLWFKFGTGSKRRYIPFHDSVERLGYTF